MHKLTRRTALKGLGLAGGAAVAGRLALAQLETREAETREVPWLLEIQQPPAKLPPNAPKLRPLLVDERDKPITTLEGWKARRAELRRWWLDFLGPLPAERKSVPNLTVVEEDRPDGVIRQLVKYDV